jgi:hypothetical protein
MSSYELPLPFLFRVFLLNFVSDLNLISTGLGNPDSASIAGAGILFWIYG